MARDKRFEAALALHRFGLGPRVGSIATIASDPRAALLEELRRPGVEYVSDPQLSSSANALRSVNLQREQRRAMLPAKGEPTSAQRRRAAPPSISPDRRQPSAAPDTSPAVPPPSSAQRLSPQQQIYLHEADARLKAAVSTNIGLVERLVWFWSNHFCVSADKGVVRAIAGAYEREAIRPHVLGRFQNMLVSAESHPAMLVYLDNAKSLGPNSVAGRRQQRGLNENLAREILELHTLGVRTVYDQKDVTNLAKVLTGWTVISLRVDPDRAGEFGFNPRMHEPGPHTVLGKTYAQGGVEQGRAALVDIARHPATARHVSTKLARHFVADEPPRALVERLTRSFLDTEGDLRELAAVLVSSPECWQGERTKLKRPGEWLVATLRACDVRELDVPYLVQALARLGEPLWRPPAPNGFSDLAPVWLNGLSIRLDFANSLSWRLANLAHPVEAAEVALGPLASRETQAAIAFAENRQQGFTLLMMAPEFLWR
jgi:uncharacterized protein (DUF1800 family)